MQRVGRLQPWSVVLTHVTASAWLVFDDQDDVVGLTAFLESLGIEQVKPAIAGIDSGGCTDLSAGYLLDLSEANCAKGSHRVASRRSLMTSHGGE